MEVRITDSFKHKLSILYNKSEIDKRIIMLAGEIAEYLKSQNISNKDLFIICLLKGSFVFTADLIRGLYELNIHPQLDFMAVSSYGNNKQSSGKININSDIREDIKGKHILLVDDILESGNTLFAVKNILNERGAKTIKTAVFLEKPGKLKKDIKADFIGFKVTDKFIVGYGLDYANFYRELPFIATIEE